MKIETFPLEIKKSIKFNNNYKINVFGEGIYDTNKNPQKEKNNRFGLKLEIENPKGNKPLIVIMMNPSETFPKSENRESQIDETVQNVIRIAYVCGYNKVYVYNVFPLINPKSSFLYLKDDFYDFNKELIIEFLTLHKSYDTLIAWGTKIKKEDIIDFLKREGNNIKILDCLKNRNLFVWEFTPTTKLPMHPSPRNRGKINSFLKQPNPKLKPIKFDDNGNVIAC